MPNSLSIPHWVRLYVTGRDRAKFLHNFCTNDVKSLTAGSACEAFFTDVRARVLGHGYVIAFEDRHEIWLLSGTETDLLKHLTRYIITEDVSITLLQSQRFEAVSTCVESIDVLNRVSNGNYLPPVAPLQAISLTQLPTGGDGFRACALLINWANRFFILFAGDDVSITALGKQLSEGGVAMLDRGDLERLRIEERFPVIGRDLTGDHLAPEAERNSTAINYHKGCYLGQEPIARLDAMGHINRALRRIEIDAPVGGIHGSSLQSASGTTIGSLTSVTDMQNGLCNGLAVVRLAGLSQEIVAVTDAGGQFPARVLPL